MEYPGNFDTPAFPAGKRIAVSRAMGIGILAAFLLIPCMCGLVWWGVQSMRVNPFLISVDQNSGAWRVIGRSDDSVDINRTVQESVVANFVQNWFYISPAVTENEAVWRNCEYKTRENCTGAETMTYGEKTCAIYCAAQEDLYDKFVKDVVPGYSLRGAEGETWNVMEKSLVLTPVGKIDEKGGVWRANATVWSNINASFNIVAFVRVAQRNGLYPMAMGYYISDFNAYRIN